jgi:hypothetical protein
MFVPVLTMLVSRRRVLLALLVLAVGVMVGRLMMMVCGSVMVRSGLVVMLDGRVIGLVCHGLVLLEGFAETRVHRAQNSVAVSPPTGAPTTFVQSIFDTAHRLGGRPEPVANRAGPTTHREDRARLRDRLNLPGKLG